MDKVLYESFDFREGKMNSDNILINEYNAILNLRERSIKSVEGSSNSYFTFLGLLATAFSFSFDAIKQDESLMLIVIFVCVSVVVFGIWIYHRTISSLTNFTIYTRQLNLTRKELVKNISGLKDKIFLPTDGTKPEFDGMGFLGEKFSKHGFLAFINWIDSIIVGIIVYLSVDMYFLDDIINSTAISNEPYINFGLFSLAFSCFISSFYLHNCHNEFMIFKAKKKWDNEKTPKL